MYSCKKFIIKFETVFSYQGLWNNYTVQQILQRLQTDQYNHSCDEDEKSDLQDKDLISTFNAGVESSDSEDEQDSAAVSVTTPSSVATPSDKSSSQNTVGELKAQNGTVWKNITGGQGM